MEKIKEFLNEKYLSIEEVYEAKEKYNVVYINENLYEEIFNEKYDWEIASAKIADMFSITLDKEKSNGNRIGEVFADMQKDPFGIALSNNLGSGRAFFYGSNFNIKGEKTKLATSPKSIYSNGKYALSASLKETVISNILAKDFIVSPFESLAILDKKEKYNFEEEYLDENDEIKVREFYLPCAIEIRYYKEKELYRISNSIINGDKISEKYIKILAENIAKIEANKFSDRFLHGSWSSGNISTNCNLIDFDTSAFVKSRFPQYSNTFKYKSNFFGYEIDGQKLMLNSIIDNEDLENREKLKKEISIIMDNTYNENLKIRFCDLIGLNYNIHYKIYSEEIDYLYEKFNELSRKFVPNYYATNIAEKSEDITFLFDFSNFFQKYLIKKDTENYNIFSGMQLLINNTEELVYDKVGFIKEKIEELFKEDLVQAENKDIYLIEAMKFIEKYDELFYKVKKEFDLEEIKLKQYIINSERNYITGNSYVYGDLSYEYDNQKKDSKTLNKIITSLIKTNLKNNYEKKEEISFGLKLHDNYLTYWNISKKYYYIVLEPFSNLQIDFAKLIFNGEELMLSHSKNGNGKILISEKIYFENLDDILNSDVQVKINGK